ncbi:uncharacterized protein MONBRDRAFT_29626 [Monosiga brevicollis MX1]|uniref:RRM domain-containing protein n=1 Tax=Monosiga brevicollis TaxID=81824 RepID=A9VBN2_MONBE|nr:uncharacterized protein MONBRDRAFT_29626 [Monosiga brevicollis MX1]EDQ85092.1 predicted protein [Monosiga brevicollis MX1]|eukprot:XP_001750096.1 hypothetical protein [Monosiga brevicollis MX1]
MAQCRPLDLTGVLVMHKAGALILLRTVSVVPSPRPLVFTSVTDQSRQVFVGNLPDDIEKMDLENEFRQFGRLLDVWVARKPPGFAFVKFEDQRDAEDAVQGLNRRTAFGREIRVEISHGGRGGRGGGMFAATLSSI